MVVISALNWKYETHLTVNCSCLANDPINQNLTPWCDPIKSLPLFVKYKYPRMSGNTRHPSDAW